MLVVGIAGARSGLCLGHGAQCLSTMVGSRQYGKTSIWSADEVSLAPRVSALVRDVVVEGLIVNVNSCEDGVASYCPKRATSVAWDEWHVSYASAEAD